MLKFMNELGFLMYSLSKIVRLSQQHLIVSVRNLQTYSVTQSTNAEVVLGSNPSRCNSLNNRLPKMKRKKMSVDNRLRLFGIPLKC